MARRRDTARQAPAESDSADAGTASEEHEYNVLEAGTIIDGKQFPGEDGEMTVMLTEERAKELQAGGVCLSKASQD